MEVIGFSNDSFGFNNLSKNCDTLNCDNKDEEETPCNTQSFISY